MDHGQNRFEKAIVIGGSIAGLLAARILSDYFRRVIVIERDWRTEQPGAGRKGVPQGRHAHALLVRGERIISRYFPGIRDALLREGATAVNMGHDMRWHHSGVWKARYRSDIEMISLSRPLLEWHIAERLRLLPNVDVIDGCSVRRLDCEQDRIMGVHLQGRQSRFDRQYLSADLIVDAGGRGSATPTQLVDAGFERPAESSATIDLVYASRLLRVPAGERDWKCLYVIAQPPQKRGALILPIEGDRWLVTAYGVHGDHPPTDDAGFLQFVRELPVPDIYRAIKEAEPLTDIVRHGTRSSVRRHYERLQRFPDGLLVTGDAICSFNPSYGQGMSTAALYAEVLQECLETRLQRGAGLNGLWRDFFKGAAAAADAPWQLASSEDFRHRQTVGRRGPAMRLLHWYTRTAQAASGRDTRVAERVYEVMHLLKAPSALFSPDIVRRVLFGSSSHSAPRDTDLNQQLSDDDPTHVRTGSKETTQPG